MADLLLVEDRDATEELLGDALGLPLWDRSNSLEILPQVTQGGVLHSNVDELLLWVFVPAEKLYK